MTATPLVLPDDAATQLAPFIGLSLADIMVVATLDDAQFASAELLQHTAVGFDTESRPVFHRHQSSDGPHVVQFATPHKAYIFQTRLSVCHAAISTVLASRTTAKVGFGLANDMTYISRKFGVTPRAVIDLNNKFHTLGYKNCVGARTAIALLFQQRFTKSKRITTSNWSVSTLTQKQVLYAANDAYAALQVYRALAQPQHRRRLSRAADYATISKV